MRPPRGLRGPRPVLLVAERPEQLGRLRWPQQLASNRPEVEEVPLPTYGKGWEVGTVLSDGNKGLLFSPDILRVCSLHPTPTG